MLPCSTPFSTSGPQDPPVMEVQVKVLSQIKKQFVWRRVSLWSKLGNTKPKKKVALADMGAMVCTVGLDMFWDLGLQKYVMEKTKMVVRGVKRSNKRVEAAMNTAKWLLFNNTERGDMINTKGVAKALLQ